MFQYGSYREINNVHVDYAVHKGVLLSKVLEKENLGVVRYWIRHLISRDVLPPCAIRSRRKMMTETLEILRFIYLIKR